MPALSYLSYLSYPSLILLSMREALNPPTPPQSPVILQSHGFYNDLAVLPDGVCMVGTDPIRVPNGRTLTVPYVCIQPRRPLASTCVRACRPHPSSCPRTVTPRAPCSAITWP